MSEFYDDNFDAVSFALFEKTGGPELEEYFWEVYMGSCQDAVNNSYQEGMTDFNEWLEASVSRIS